MPFDNLTFVSSFFKAIINRNSLVPYFFSSSIRADVRKVVVLGGGGRGADHNYRSKNYHFLFLLKFDAEAFKTCENTIKLFNLCAPPCLERLNTIMNKIYIFNAYVS